MATIIRIDTNSKAAQAFIAFVKTLPFAKIVESNTVHEPHVEYNAETIKAIENARAGVGVVKTKNHADLMKKLRL